MRTWLRLTAPVYASVDPSTTPHRIPTVEALVAGAAADGDGAADVAGGGVGLELGALLAEGIDDDCEAEVGAAGAGGWGLRVASILVGAGASTLLSTGALGVIAGEGEGVGGESAVAVAV